MNQVTLSEHLSCPIEWQIVCPEAEFVDWLNFGWYAICARHQTDREASFNFSYEDFGVDEASIEQLDETELAASVHNVLGWAEAARNEYLHFYRRFVQLSAVGTKTHSKHYSAVASSTTDIASESSSRGASVLLSYITPPIQESLLWATLDELTQQEACEFDRLTRFSNPAAADRKFRELFDRHKLIVAVDFCRPCGASAGKLSQFACIDIDFSTPQFHIYPISKDEHDSAKLRCRVQGWNYGLQA